MPPRAPLLRPEARKFGLTLTLAHQLLQQIEVERILKAVFGNVGNLISFRLGQEDAGVLERELAPSFTRADLVNLPNWHACASLLIDGQVTPPFIMRTEPLNGVRSEQRARAVRARSRKMYGVPRKVI